MSTNRSAQCHSKGLLNMTASQEEMTEGGKKSMQGIALTALLLTLLEKPADTLVERCMQKSSVTVFQSMFTTTMLVHRAWPLVHWATICISWQGNKQWTCLLCTGHGHGLCSLSHDTVLVCWAVTTTFVHRAMTTAFVHWATTTVLVRMFRYRAPRTISRMPIMNAPANSKQVTQIRNKIWRCAFFSSMSGMFRNEYVWTHTFCFLVNRLFLAPPEGCSVLRS